MKKLTITILIAAFGFVNALFADIEEKIHKNFKVSEGGTLTIESDLGSIEVAPGGGNEVDIEIIQTVGTNSEKRAKSILEDLEIEFKQTGNDVNVFVEYVGEKFFNWGDRRLKLKFIVQVPQKYNVDLRTSGGSISVDDLIGTARAKTSGGSLNFGSIQGPVTGNTSGGSITLEGCEGTADIKTSGGGIHIGNVNGTVDAHTSGGSITIQQAKGDVTASTSGGSINVNEVMGSIDASTSGGSVSAFITKQPEASCRLTTSGGGVNVHLAPEIKVNLDAKTSGGRVVTDFPVTLQGEIKKTELQAEINGGGPELYLRTSGGSIHINKI